MSPIPSQTSLGLPRGENHTDPVDATAPPTAAKERLKFHLQHFALFPWAFPPSLTEFCKGAL